MPLLKERREKRRRALGVEALRPWDFQVDPKGRTPLKPFETTEELETTLHPAFFQTSTRL